jgi:hypothetical protein
VLLAPQAASNTTPLNASKREAYIDPPLQRFSAESSARHWFCHRSAQ